MASKRKKKIGNCHHRQTKVTPTSLGSSTDFPEPSPVSPIHFFIIPFIFLFQYFSLIRFHSSLLTLFISIVVIGASIQFHLLLRFCFLCISVFYLVVVDDVDEQSWNLYWMLPLPYRHRDWSYCYCHCLHSVPLTMMLIIRFLIMITNWMEKKRKKETCVWTKNLFSFLWSCLADVHSFMYVFLFYVFDFSNCNNNNNCKSTKHYESQKQNTNRTPGTLLKKIYRTLN